MVSEIPSPFKRIECHFDCLSAFCLAVPHFWLTMRNAVSVPWFFGDGISICIDFALYIAILCHDDFRLASQCYLRMHLQSPMPSKFLMRAQSELALFDIIFIIWLDDIIIWLMAHYWWDIFDTFFKCKPFPFTMFPFEEFRWATPLMLDEYHEVIFHFIVLHMEDQTYWGIWFHRQYGRPSH